MDRSHRALALFLTAALAAGLACGDDDATDGMDAGTIGSTDTGSSGSTDTGTPVTDSGVNPGDIDSVYDCDEQDVATCDYVACSVDAGYAALTIACSSPAAPTYCDDVEACFGTYAGCITVACPVGSAIADNNADDISACSDAYQACVDTATGG